MNRSKIEWCDHTWNPVTGCREGCAYCYAKAMTSRFAGDIRLNMMASEDYKKVSAADGGKQVYVLEKPMLNTTGNRLVYPFGFEPTFHRYRINSLNTLKSGKNVFVGAMTDMFGSCVPDEWISEVMNYCAENQKHNYLFLTKNPKRYVEFFCKCSDFKEEFLSKSMWYGTTVTRTCELSRINYLPESECGAFVSIEPILEDVLLWTNEAPASKLNWIIIGAQTGRGTDKVVPKKEWIENIVSFADKYRIPVFMKDSLISIVEESNMRRDFPQQLQHTEISPKMKKKLYDVCADCNAHMKKRDMITLLARSKRGEQPKQFGFMCRECFRNFCRELGIDVPKLAELTDTFTIGPGDEFKESEE